VGSIWVSKTYYLRSN